MTVLHQFQPYEMLMQDAWLHWNKETWGLEPERVRYASGGAELSGVLYTDRRGRVRMPPLSPYLPLRFNPTATERTDRLERQWLAVGDLMAEDLAARGISGRIAFPPGVLDARPFLWRGFRAEVRYTYVTNLPYSRELAASAVRKNINKAMRAKFTFEPNVRPSDLVDCLEATGGRQGFSYRLDERSITSLFDLLDPANVRGHVVRDTAGVAVSAGLRLMTPEGIALDWVQGTRAGALRDGAVQMMYGGAIDDLAEQGASAFDFGGANIANVAAAKATWGMGLSPFLTIRQYDSRHLLETAGGVAKRAKHLFSAKIR
jgi:hypothetical protein